MKIHIGNKFGCFVLSACPWKAGERHYCVSNDNVERDYVFTQDEQGTKYMAVLAIPEETNEQPIRKL